MTRTAIALGSNLGRRLAHLQEARDMLKYIASPAEPFLQAPVYQTSPVGCPANSPDFFNTVIEFSFSGSAFDLLGYAQAIEFKLGRAVVPERNAPRIIDVDILYFGEERIDLGLLELPHPRMAGRRFVLQPLSDIRPDFILPGSKETILEYLRHFVFAEPKPMLVQANW